MRAHEACLALTLLWRLLDLGASALGRAGTSTGPVAEELRKAIGQVNEGRVEAVKLWEAGEWEGWNKPTTAPHTMSVEETMARAYAMTAEHGRGASTAATPEDQATEQARIEAIEEKQTDELEAAVKATDCSECAMFRSAFEILDMLCPGCREQLAA